MSARYRAQQQQRQKQMLVQNHRAQDVLEEQIMGLQPKMEMIKNLESLHERTQDKQLGLQLEMERRKLAQEISELSQHYKIDIVQIYSKLQGEKQSNDILEAREKQKERLEKGQSKEDIIDLYNENNELIARHKAGEKRPEWIENLLEQTQMSNKGYGYRPKDEDIGKYLNHLGINEGEQEQFLANRKNMHLYEFRARQHEHPITYEMARNREKEIESQRNLRHQERAQRLLLEKEIAERILQQNNAAIKLQAVLRGKQAKKELQERLYKEEEKKNKQMRIQKGQHYTQKNQQRKQRVKEYKEQQQREQEEQELKPAVSFQNTQKLIQLAREEKQRILEKEKGNILNQHLQKYDKKQHEKNELKGIMEDIKQHLEQKKQYPLFQQEEEKHQLKEEYDPLKVQEEEKQYPLEEEQKQKQQKPKQQKPKQVYVEDLNLEKYQSLHQIYKLFSAMKNRQNTFIKLDEQEKDKLSSFGIKLGKNKDEYSVKTLFNKIKNKYEAGQNPQVQ